MYQSRLLEKSRQMSNEFNENVALYYSVIESPGRDLETLFQRAIALFNLFRYTQCLDVLKEILKANTKNLNALHLQAQAHRKLDQYSLSNLSLDKCIQLNPNNQQFYFEKALNYEDLNLLEKAGSCLSKVTILDPNCSEAYFKKGCLFYGLKQKQTAISEFNEAIRLDPNNEEFYLNRALCYFDILKYDESLIDLDKVLDISPNNIEAISKKCVILEKLNRHREAISLIEDLMYGGVNCVLKDSRIESEVLSHESLGQMDVLTTESVADLNFIRIRLLVVMKEYKKAAELLHSEIIQNKGPNEGWFYLSILNYQIGDLETAKTHISKAIQGNSNNYHFYCFRGFLYLPDEKPKTLTDFQKASKLYALNIQDEYITSDNQRRLSQEFIQGFPFMVSIFQEIISSVCYLDMNFRTAFRDPAKVQKKFSNLLGQYNIKHLEVIELFREWYSLDKDRSRILILKSEFEKMNAQLFEMTRKYSIIFEINYETQVFPGLFAEIERYKKEEKSLNHYIEIFYGTWMAYLHEMEILGDSLYQIKIDEESLFFDKFNDLAKIKQFETICSLIFGKKNVGKRNDRVSKFELLFDQNVHQKTSEDYKIFILQICMQLLNNNLKRGTINGKKMTPDFDDCWESIRGFLKSIGKYDKFKKIVENEVQKMAFCDALFAICLLNEEGDYCINSSIIFADEIICLILTDRHINFQKKLKFEIEKSSQFGNFLKAL